MWDIVLAAVLPVILTPMVGYLLVRLGKPVEGDSLRILVSNIGTPALVFTSLAKLSLSGSVVALYVLATFACIFCYWLISLVMLRITGLSTRTYLQPLMFGNVGNLGLPLALYAAGPAGMGFASIIFVIHSVGNFTLGQAICAGRGNLKHVMQSPNLYAAIVGLAWNFLHLPQPTWLMNTASLLGSIVVPMMLIMLGTSLAKIHVSMFKRAFLLGLFRLALGTSVGWAISTLFGFTGMAQMIMILLSASPPAVYNYLFAIIWKTEPEQVASLVVVGTQISAVWIPILLAFLVGH